MLAKPRFLRFLGDIVRNKIAENMKIFVKIDKIKPHVFLGQLEAIRSAVPE